MTKTQKTTNNMILILTAGILLLLGGCLVTWHHYHTTAWCEMNNLTLSKGTSNGTAGTIYTDAVLTNSGNTTCKIAGYPAAFLKDASSMTLGTGAAANSLYTPSVITLTAHAQAHTVLGFPDAGNFTPGTCTAPSAKLAIFIPGATTALQTSWNDAYCPGFSATALRAGS